MRTLRSFLLDAYWAHDALAEAEGFKSGAEKRRKNREAFLKARRRDTLPQKKRDRRNWMTSSHRPKNGGTFSERSKRTLCLFRGCN